mgnify:CR=1 FL=1
MAKPLRNMNSRAYDIANTSFKNLLKGGAFPKIQYKESPGTYGGISTSYEMIEYSTIWGKYTKVIQNKLIAKGFEFGLWQNARNSKYIVAVEDATYSTTEQEVNESTERFKGIFG